MELESYLESMLTHFHKPSDGLLGSRTVVFHVKTKIGRRDRSRTLRIELAGNWRRFLDVHHGTGEALQ
jgi:hypothetical protein